MIKRIKELREEIRKHDALYDDGAPIISDSEYDELYLELESLEREHPELWDPLSPTQKIATTIVKGLKKIKHRTPMLSQQKLTTQASVLSFIQGIPPGEAMKLLVQEKLDGITIVLSYEKGRLVEAVSRGNGEVGEDLLHNVKTFQNLPKVISFKGRLEVRAEAVLPFEDFRGINTEGEYSNPRNLVSGSLRQLDSGKVAGKGFKAIVFELVYAEGKTHEDFEDSDWNRLRFLKELGFEVVNTSSFDIDEGSGIAGYLDEFGRNIRPSLPHMIDGMVLKVDSLTLRDNLGHTSKHPRWAAAYKFKSLESTTRLLGITDQVGKTGQITPVAELEPVNIDGVNIARATLHNYELLGKKDLRIGDLVLVERANDVIPQVVKAITVHRTGSEVIKSAPLHCPVCGSAVEKSGENLYCTGLACDPQIAGKLQHYVSRDAMNIDGLGEKTVEMLYEQGIISNILDIYSLEEKRSQICALEGFGVKKFEKMVQGIEASKERPLSNVFFALSIPNTGLGSGKRIARVFTSLEDLLLLGQVSRAEAMEKLLSVEDFGETKAKSVYSFFMDKTNAEIIKGMIALGINPSTAPPPLSTESAVFGKTFVITGALEKYSNRKELEAKIEELGGRVSGSVSKNTDYLINNDKDSNSSKNQKAKGLGVKIITEKEFISYTPF